MDDADRPKCDTTPIPPPVDAVPLARPVSFASHGPAGHDLLLRNQTRAAAWVDLLLFVVLFAALALLGESLLAAGYMTATGMVIEDEATEARVEKALLFPALTWRTILAVVLAACFVRRRGGRASSVGVTGRGLATDVLIGMVTAATTGLFIAAVNLTLIFSFPDFAAQMTENGARIMERVPKASPAAFAGITLLIGVYEELVFRGFLMPRLRRATGSWSAAVVATTAVFATLHLADQVAAVLVSITLLSLVLSLVTIWRKSIVPAVVAHALFDFSSFMLLYVQAGDQWK